ncbi:AraC family transcriptional regulator [Oceanobacter mangrovi]|uniref:AraC family transcriptional regulator n=1 Tax=Oceanobacter mangrovi TaxID=2862510 RepID=UPI001C8EA877|nr:AraC family transcriptional regulator [Oceanobacter mangrovi]
MKLGDISISYVELMARAARQLGYDPSAVLQAYQLPPERLALPGNRVSIPRFMRVGHELIESTRAPYLGLQMGVLSGPSVMGLAGWIAHSAASVRSACEALVRYELLCSFNARGRSAFVVEGGKGRMCFYSISPYNDYNRFVVDLVLVGWKTLLEQMAGKSLIEAILIEFPAPEYQADYPRFVDCPVVFGAGQNALLLRDGALEQMLTQSCASSHRWLVEQAELELDKVRRGLSVAEQVARALSPLLVGHAPELSEVARQLGKPPWTLKRLLAAESTNYQTVLDDTRRELALAYVRETGLAIGEIAYLTGFGSATAFQRAFKRWTNQTPRQLRQS